MAKNETSKNADTTLEVPVAAPAAAVAQPQSAPRIALRLGSAVTVKLADGVSLHNNEAGVDFAPGQPVQVTVTVTMLRRLQDGDLVLV